MGSRKCTILSNDCTQPVADKDQEYDDATLMQRKLSGSDSSASSLSSSPIANGSVSSRSSTRITQPRPLQVSLPSSWYTSENFFALEARAIFSQVLPHHNCEPHLREPGVALCDAQQSIPRERHVLSLPRWNLSNLFDTLQGRNHTWLPQHLPPSWLSGCI